MPLHPETLDRLARARLYLVLSRSLCRIPPIEVLAGALEGGVDLVQIREPDLADGALLAWVRDVRRAASRSGVPVIVNNRPDVARIAGADGVHVGQGDLPPADVRDLCGDRMIIGLSTHERAEIEQASALPVDYCGLGPVFDTSTKGLVGRGLDLLREALPRATKPVFAIGGINAENAPALRAAGVERIAVSSAICGARDPAAVARALRAAMG